MGTRVCEQGIKMGVDVISISRHGRPAHLANAPWADTIQWVHGDVFDTNKAWRDTLKGAAGVFSTLGAFGSNEFMYKMCGTANMQLMDVAKEAGVPRFGFVSVHDFKFPGGWRAQQFLLKGYFQGKRDAEKHLAELYPDTGVALRPGFIYGTRVAGSRTMPLGVVGAPLSAALSILPTKSLSSTPIIGAAFVPPISVETVGKAAANAVIDPNVPAGVMDVWTMLEKYG